MQINISNLPNTVFDNVLEKSLEQLAESAKMMAQEKNSIHKV